MSIKVVAITGAGRSGSTLLDNALGAIDGFASVGELRYIWKRSLIDRRLCGCGRTVYECELWPGVFQSAYGGFDAVDIRHVASLMERIRTRYTPASVLPPLRPWYRAKLAPLVPYLDRLYPAIGAMTGSRVVVDSSKVPAHTFLLSLVPSIDLHVVHLVRDPRAVAHSQSRSKQQLDTAVAREMTRVPPVRSAADWIMWNASTRAIFKRSASYTLVTYESLVGEPHATVRAVLDAIGEPSASSPVTSEGELELRPNHTVSGNPSRFSQGTVTIRGDEAWIRDMRALDRRVVTTLTFPFLHTYGYPVVARRDRAE